MPSTRLRTALPPRSALSGQDLRPGRTARLLAQFEPEGGIRALAPGDELTITLTGEGPRHVDVYRYDDGVVIWRPRDSNDITITDQHDEAVTDLW